MLKDKRYGSADWLRAEAVDELGMQHPVAENFPSWPICPPGVLKNPGWFQQRPKTTQALIGPAEGHELVLGPPGSGKFVNAFGVTLLNDDGANVVVLDPASGELCNAAREFRRSLGQGAVIDPLGVFNFTSGRLNPLDLVRYSAAPQAEAERLGAALLEQKGDNGEWVQAARDVASATMLYLVERKGAAATLLDLAEIAADDWSEAVLDEMAASQHAMVRLEAANIRSDKRAQKTWAGVKFSMRAALAFARQEGVRRTLVDSTFDPLRLRTERFSVFVVLPNDALRDMGPWLRLVYATIMGRIGRRFHAGDRRVRFIVDEFPSLGRFDELALIDLPNVRKFGVSIHLAAQSLSQLEALYGPAGRSAIQASCRIQRVLGVNDVFTAEIISAMLGQTTVASRKPHKPTPGEWPWPQPDYEYNGRPLLTPGEVMALRPDEQLIFVGGKGALRAPRWSILTDAPFAGRLDNLKARRAGPRA